MIRPAVHSKGKTWETKSPGKIDEEDEGRRRSKSFGEIETKGAHEAYAAAVAAAGIATALGRKARRGDPIAARFRREKDRPNVARLQAGKAGVVGADREGAMLQARVRETLDEENGVKKPQIAPPIFFVARAWLRACLSDPASAFMLDFVQTVLSLVACVLYVVSTELEQDGPTLPTWYIVAEVFIFICFTFDYLMRLVATTDWVGYVTSWSAMVDLLSILPAISLVVDTSSVSIGFLRVLRGLRVIRILRSYRALADARTDGEDEQSQASAEKSLRRQIVYLALTIVSFVFITSGIIHTLEVWLPGSFARSNMPEDCAMDVYREERVPPHLWPDGCYFDFATAVYFTVVSVTTVGYGDVVPTTGVAKMGTVVMICVLFVLIPIETSKLSDLLAQSSPYSEPFRRGPGGHVVICGDVSAESAQRILVELFHPDHGHTRRRVVFLQQRTPSSEWVRVLHNPRHESDVQYVLGSALSLADLRRAAISSADAVFVLTNSARDASNEQAFAADAAALLTTRAIRDTAPRAPILLQLLRRDSVERNAWARADLVVCHQSLRMSLLAMNTLYPGMATMVANLVNTFDSEDGADYIIGAGDKARAGDEADNETEAYIESHGLGPDASHWKGYDPDDKLDGLRGARDDARNRARAWRAEYADGMQQELYAVPISPVFVARRFDEAAMVVHRLYGVTRK